MVFASVVRLIRKSHCAKQNFCLNIHTGSGYKKSLLAR